MTTLPSRYSLCIGAAAAFLAGCAQAENNLQPTVRMPGMTHRILPASSSYQILHSFTKISRGAHPFARLIAVNGTLYGTTLRGGSSDNGIVFSISTTGHTKVLHSFSGGADGAWPRSALIDVNGTLYGTTSQGGGSGCNHSYGCGTVYSISTSGSEKVLYRFAGGSDGSNPWAGLIEVNGKLYGTTESGGSHYNLGTVYSISKSGSEKVLYRFGSRAFDGWFPEADLVAVNGMLYGTTYNGGTGNCQMYGSCGTVFSVSTTGVEKVVYNFTGGYDGAFPQSGLIDVKGTLYGTTDAGGYSGCTLNGCGTVYSVSTTGSEKVLHRFGQGSDGFNPEAGLIDVSGTLYGTTAYNNGAVYTITTAGAEKVLHTFGKAPGDGVIPLGGLVNLKGTLYGTTAWGGVGCGSMGCGVVFALSP